MKILSAAEMQACDQRTTELLGISSVQLMRNAAQAIFGFVQLQFPLAKNITVLSGRGNNGGDGLMAARLLAQAGCHATVLLLGETAGVRGDAAIALRELLEPMLN